MNSTPSEDPTPVALAILRGLKAVLEQEISIKDYVNLAVSRDLALAATPASVAQLVSALSQAVEQSGQVTLFLASGIELHASALFKVGRNRLALPLYDAIRPLFEQQGPPGLLARCYNHRAIVLGQLGELRQAVQGHELAITIFRRCLGAPEGRTNLADELAGALINKGVALRQLGELRQAVQEYEEAIAIYRRLVEVEGRTKLANDLAGAIMNKGIVLADLGELREAVQEYEQAVIIYRLVEQEGRAEFANDLATALTNMGNALRRLGRLREAVQEFEQAIAIRRRLVEQEGRTELANDLASSLMNKGIALTDLGQMREAVQEYDQTIPLLRRLVEQGGRTDLANLLAAALTNKGAALADLGQFPEAVHEYELAITIFRRLVEQEGRSELANHLAGAIMNMGNALRQLGRLREAVQEYEQAIAIRRRLVEQEGRTELANDLAAVLINKCLALEQQGNLEQSLATYRQLDPALFRGEDLRNYYDCLSNNLWQQGQREEALEHLFLAVAAYREARRSARLDETFLEYIAQRSDFLDRAVCRSLDAGREREAFACVQDGKAGVFGDLRSRLSAQAEADPDEVRTARQQLTGWLRSSQETDPERWRAEHTRRTREYLRVWRGARSGRQIPVTPAGGSGEQPVTLEEIQATLQPGWAVLDFWRTQEEEVTAFVVTPDSFQVERLHFPVESEPSFRDNLVALHELMMRPLACLEDGATNDTTLDDLHTYLFAPLRPLLKEKAITGLYLVPQGYLHHLPLHAVRRKVKGEVRYLCDDFAVAYLPSAALLPQLPALQARGAFLSLANPDRGNADSLPFSDWEGLQLSQCLAPNGRFHRGPEATYAATDGWDAFATLHFSCDGAGDPDFAPLSRLYLHDDLLLAHDVIYRRPALREGALVILNGCQTGVRDWRAADEGLGLMSAFLLRGAGLVLSTMWSVVDACAAEMVLQFVAELIEKRQSPVEALRAAQQQARALTWEEYMRRSDEVQKMFDPDRNPQELSKLLAQKAWVSCRCGLAGEARDAAEQAAPFLRRAGLDAEAERLLALTRSDATLSGPARRALPFDHPLLWGAFQLVGRVT
jgi:tetratricopeptide (TPR) repeat protein/CHAT domain-containing protein